MCEHIAPLVWVSAVVTWDGAMPRPYMWSQVLRQPQMARARFFSHNLRLRGELFCHSWETREA